ncbi:catalase family protein [Hahella ganghwensis]|uniref:catalase family protein n=1 Tax=Hahella ganghwensis TaxID=286420 RepID=UPI00037582B9|nr:catalase family protein [Hahella ganghwensis]
MKTLPQWIHRSATLAAGVIRRLDPYYRDSFDRYFRPSIESLAQTIIRLRLKDHGLDLGQELIRDDEEQVTTEIADTMNRFLIRHYRNTGKTAERAGNTKTYGLLKASFTIDDKLPRELKVGLFKKKQTFPAYVRFAGPGPLVTRDVDNNGILSIGIKVMGVPGPKLLDDEKSTHDFLGISSPTFTTPDIYENLKLQQAIEKDAPVWYFINPLDSHYLDAVMQGLYARTHANPLELTYNSCVPYRYGNNRAVKYIFRPRISQKSKVGRLTENYLREAMVETLAQHPVTFDLYIQIQTDPVSMPLENASVVWSERSSPPIRVATIRIPRQTFDSPAQLAFARNLTFNPWHALAEHKPLGNQNRARKYIYQATSRMRQGINKEQHIEPTGDEVFV